MRPHHLRLFSAMFACALLVLIIALPFTHDAGARSADFAPPFSAEQATARLETARKQHAMRRSPAAVIDTVYFAETGFQLSNQAGFLNYWRSQGGVLLFGYPLSEEFEENGRLVQYFERARFEYHPELAGTPYAVQLGLLGRETTAGRVFDAAQPMQGARFFPETGHNLYDKFLRFWQKRGGVASFGYPISEEFDEVDAQGVTRRVQYFERARFEWHPEAMPDYYRRAEARNNILLLAMHEIELADIGRQVLAQRNIQPAPLQAQSAAPQWSPALWPHSILVDLSQQWLYAYEGDLLVYDAPVSTGRNGFRTPTGEYAVYHKTRAQTMDGSAGGETWNVPNVPWVMYVVGGVAIHGTYWHDRFGSGARPSHGCINVNLDDAQWLYAWAGMGTAVTIRQ